MGELRLKCPECGTEYRLAEGAIPAAGRNVECSSCGHVWLQPGNAPAPATKAPQATPESAPKTPAASQPQPQLNRPLPASVLSVLQEEAELSRRQRGGEVAPPAAPPKQPPGEPAEDWPATTVTDGASVGASMTLPLATDRPQTGPAPSRHINAKPSRPAQAAPAHQTMEETVTRTTPHRADPPPEPQKEAADLSSIARPIDDHGSSAYRRGLRWSIAIAAALLLVYLAAPRLADQGAPGAKLMEWRIAVDDGRNWLHQRLFAPQTETD
ncbi:zinc-ribbon domain-containing protein [Paracoccus tegillarcae]|nr:zinc-ribbon domain-containing protein [Paracoccus tegillarcae]